MIRKMTPTYAQIREEIESSIAENHIVSGFEYDRNNWLALTTVDLYDKDRVYSWPDGANRVQIYYESKNSKQAVVAEGYDHSVPIPTEPRNMELFPRFFHIFKVHDVGYLGGNHIPFGRPQLQLLVRKVFELVHVSSIIKDL